MDTRMIAALTGLACVALSAAMPHVQAQSPASMPASRPQRGGAQGIVAPGARVVELAKGFQFTEGPAVDREGNVFFSDVRASRTYKWSTDGKVSLFRKDTGGANGLAFDKDGNLLACEGAGGRVVSIDAKGNVTVVAGAYGGKPFNRPNDLWIDPKGGVYFSDPLYGRGSRRQDGEHVYYVTPDRKKVIRVIDDMVRPNGLAGTPDGKTLYVADAGAGKTYRYAANADGTLRDKRLFVAKGSDGMKLDRKGNVYLTADAVLVYDPAGKQIAKIEVPLRPTNLCFAGPDGRTLFITARSAIYAVETTVGGSAPSGKRRSGTRTAAWVGSPLAALPSKPGPHIAKIKALGDNSWLELGAPSPDPKWGPARGRSWSASMPYAPKLGGAFIFGNGPHGAMFKGNHYGDELYFYDANAHAWICCYPGFDVTRYDEVKINKDGFEEIDGGPVPIAPMVHTWTMVGYDVHLRRFMCMPIDNAAYWGSRFKTRRAFLERHKDRLNRTHASPWTWDAKKGTWGRLKTASASPHRRYGVLFYVPSKKKTWYYHCNTKMVFYYDAATNDWTRAETKGPKPPFGIDPTACLDAKRDRVYFGGGAAGPRGSGLEKDRNALWIYDFKADAFIDPALKGPPPGGSNRYGTQAAMMHYDSASDVVVVIRHKGKAGETGVFIYDPAENRWTTATTQLPSWVGNTRSGFYHPEWNAHVIHSAHDGRTNGKMFVYRHKRHVEKDQK